LIRALLLSSTLAFTSFAAQAQHSDWPKYCGNLEMTGVAASGGPLSPTTAAALAPLWRVSLDGPVASSPTVAGDLVYIGDWTGLEYALDITTGALAASVNLGTTTNTHCEPATIGITSAAAVSGGTVYVAGGDDSFYALDAQTLNAVWQQRLGDNSESGGYYGWCSPAVTDGRVLQGVSSNCDSPFVAGRVVGFDVSTGQITQDEYLITPEWPHDAVGSGVWTSPAVDVDAGKVFVVTGSADSVEDGLAFSIVRLSKDPLSVEDSWKLQVGDAADADWGSSPTLFHADEEPLVGAGQKDGSYYAFRRDDLAAGPVWIASLAQGGACPTCADGILSTAAFDGTRLYVGSGRPLASPDSLGAVSALDPATGNVLWQTTFDGPVIAPVSYTNGVVLTTAGRHAYALDATSGRVLWSFTTAESCVGGIAITDRGIFFGDLGGNLYAFATAERPSRSRVVRTRQ
jgi:outer membrane protein assembly factor BamB